MSTGLDATVPTTRATPVTRLDAVVIGAGITGMYQLYKMRELGLNVRAYETGSGVGGTWYWNRYPGARVDSQAEIYNYWISEELYKAWKPSERFPAQPETEAWLNFVADKLDLRKDIQLSTRIVSAHYQENTGRWDVLTADGEHIDTQFLLTCCGPLSAPLINRFPGQESFRGEIHHTGLWPKGGVDVKGKRVAVVGTGATGIQVIQSMAPEVASLKVFVRTPQYMVPLKNPKYSQADWDHWASKFHETKLRVRSTFAGFDFDFANKPWVELTPAERTEILEKFWAEGTLSMWLATFPEIFFDETIGEAVSEFIREKMRERLRHDPDLCRILIPTRHTFGTHRVPLENGYLEVYLRDNVEAVDCRVSPIERIVPEGIQTADGKIHEVDVIVLAVGYDAGTGGLARIDIRGRDGRALKELWQQDIRTAMGFQVHGYPNLFMATAPLAPSAALCNVPTCAQQQVDWIVGCVDYARKNGKSVIEAKQEFEDEWVRHHDEVAGMTLLSKANSWYMGANVEGKPRRLVAYAGGVSTYNSQCDDQAAKGYPGFAMR